MPKVKKFTAHSVTKILFHAGILYRVGMEEDRCVTIGGHCRPLLDFANRSSGAHAPFVRNLNFCGGFVGDRSFITLRWGIIQRVAGDLGRVAMVDSLLGGIWVIAPIGIAGVATVDAGGPLSLR